MLKIEIPVMAYAPEGQHRTRADMSYCDLDPSMSYAAVFSVQLRKSYGIEKKDLLKKSPGSLETTHS
jgi:hypothetical protein